MFKIYQYIWILGAWEGCMWSTVHFLFIIHKMEKLQEHDLYLDQILYHFHINFFFLERIMKILQKWDPRGPPLLFLYEVSIAVLINFIVILLTPGIILIQIVNRNNTNVYLIQFHSKTNIQIRFSRKLGF